MPATIISDRFFKRYSTKQVEFVFKNKEGENKRKRKKKGARGGVGGLFLFHYIFKMHPIINAAWKFNFLWKTGGLNLTWDR